MHSDGIARFRDSSQARSFAGLIEQADSAIRPGRGNTILPSYSTQGNKAKSPLLLFSRLGYMNDATAHTYLLRYG